MSPGRITYEHPQTLVGLVLCKHCGRLMLKVGPDYVCQSTMQSDRRGCAQTSVNADTLRTFIVNRIMELVLSGTTVQDVVDKIQEKVGERDRRQREQLAETEAALHQLTQRKSQLERVAGSDVGAESSDHQDDLEDVTNRIIALECEARQHKRERVTLNKLNDTELLRKNAINLDTYNHPDYLEYTEKILEMFLDSVEVGRATATLKFRIPIPTEASPEGALSDEIGFAPTLHIKR